MIDYFFVKKMLFEQFHLIEYVIYSLLPMSTQQDVYPLHPTDIYPLHPTRHLSLPPLNPPTNLTNNFFFTVLLKGDLHNRFC